MYVWNKKQNVISPFLVWLLAILMILSFMGFFCPILAQEKPTAPIMLEGLSLIHI